MATVGSKTSGTVGIRLYPAPTNAASDLLGRMRREPMQLASELLQFLCVSDVYARMCVTVRRSVHTLLRLALKQIHIRFSQSASHQTGKVLVPWLPPLLQDRRC